MTASVRRAALPRLSCAPPSRGPSAVLPADRRVRSISRRPAGLEVAHVDCDAFYASVEKRDDPDLRDKPLIVGGSGPRGVVSTCCYVARTFGVRSAMPMARARALCPEAVVLPPDMAKYVRVGREIRGMMQALTPLVEPLSIDEAFLDLTGCAGSNGAEAAETLARFARRVEREIGVTVSVGLSYCKFLAKLASDLDKPRGFSHPAARGCESLARAAERPETLGRRQGERGAAGAAGFRRHRRPPGDRRMGGGLAPRRGRAPPVAPRQWDRRPAGRPRARDEERLERNDLRPRRRRPERTAFASCSPIATASRRGCARRGFRRAA